TWNWRSTSSEFSDRYIIWIKSNIIRSDDTYAKDRIRSAPLKRNGINPAVITVSNIKLNNFLRLSSLKEALRQIEKLCWCSNRYHQLTVDKQIDCIIDQSTDVDILSRSWDVLETFM
ncbi:unnamed protein product, partial [Rotaria magnacalcarata]